MATGSEIPEVAPATRLKRWVLGKPRELKDPKLFHRLALVAFLAWVGLGADGLSSSCYGPEEAFRALGEHRYLAVALALATAVTVFVISWSYSRIIEAFPFGGGGYVVPYKLLSPLAGVLSGSALIIDYVLTISISVASGVDAIFSHLPPQFLGMKIWVGGLAILVLLIANLRGVKESVAVLAPIFLVFLLTHALMLTVGVFGNAGRFGDVAAEARQSLAADLATPGLGFVGILLIFLRAYSLGGGTYTGIEAVANATNIMRAPVVRTAKRTMLYMSVSLALTSAGILVSYLLTDVEHVEGKTYNAVLADRTLGTWSLGSLPVGHWLAVITLFSEAALLFVAAQAGFIAGPRVMASMAVDSWLPHRFAALSERLTMRNGIVLMGVAAAVIYVQTGGSVSRLVVLYSINVFLTFSLSNIAMCVRSMRLRRAGEHWRRSLAIHGLATTLCLSILLVTTYEKFQEGGWLTLLLTGLVLTVCLLIRQHYVGVKLQIRRLEASLGAVPDTDVEPGPIDPSQPTAFLLVESYGGVGIHTLLSIFRFFPGYFKNVVFVSVAVIDSGNFKGNEEMEALEKSTIRSLTRFVDLARRLGIPATYEYRLGTDVVNEVERISDKLARTYPRHMFFGGKLIFERERWFDRLLHNETAFVIQRRLAWKGYPMSVLPVRINE